MKTEEEDGVFGCARKRQGRGVYRRSNNRYGRPLVEVSSAVMRSFKFFWNAHKWTGIVMAAAFGCTATTGFLLLIKKKAEWIQPPTLQGAPGEPEDFIPTTQLFDAVISLGHADFQVVGDIDRIDLRPAERVFKVVSRHNYAEAQVCAITGNVLNVAWRPSDLLEDIHDGSYFGDWVHEWVMPIVPAAILFLIFSGIWLWVEPIVRRRKRRSAQAMRDASSVRRIG